MTCVTGVRPQLAWTIMAPKLRGMSASTNPLAPGAGVTAMWNYTLGSIVFLFVVMDFVIVTDYLSRYAETRSWLMLALTVAAVAAAAVRIRYCWFLRVSTGNRLPPLGWTIALFAPALLSWGLAFLAPETMLFAAVQLWFSGVLFAAVLKRRIKWGVIAAVLVVTLIPVISQDTHSESLGSFIWGPERWLIIMYGTMLPFILVTSLWMWEVVRKLDEARHLAAELAVAQERLRFAADLHDIQGHHLQVIALKAELAERTLASDPAHAGAQVSEIRLIAKEAMEETRSLVAGLREVALSAELENASEVLTLSGAECELEIAGSPTGADARRVLAFAVREATTNILRHSNASAAAIVLAPTRGGFELSITNDGVGDAQPSSGGSGISGLRERVAAIGGTVDTSVGRSGAGLSDAGLSDAGLSEAAPSGSFALRVWVPEGNTR